MKNLVKIFTLVFVMYNLTFVPMANAKKEKKNNLSNLSREAIEEMKLEQNLLGLNANEYNFFESAVYNFEKMGEKAVNPLLAHLKDNRDDKKIRNSVLYTLGRLGKKASRAVPIIMTYLRHDDYDTKVTAVSSLGKIGKESNKSVATMKTLLYDDEDWLTQVTLRSLEDINTKASKSAIAEYYKFKQLKKRREERRLEQENVKKDANKSSN